MSIPSWAESVQHRIKVSYTFKKHGLSFEKELFFDVKNQGNWGRDETAEELAKQYPSTVILQNGLPSPELGMESYDGTEDTYMYSTHPVSDRNTDFVNYGKCDHLLLGRYAYKHRSLMRFDLSSIPTEVKVARAVMKIYIYRKRGKGPTGQAYEVLKKWDAGRGPGSRWVKQPVMNGEATWLCSSYPQKWDKPGGDGTGTDRSGTPVSIASAPRTNKQWIAFELPKELVQRWIARPDSNLGLMLIDKDEAKGYSSSFRSTEFYDIPFRPKLVLAFEEKLPGK
ncbi:MAG: DNRLRE domain-containing protein [Planctomycetota bacterium]|nr:DNRLRE domain-containing protein [Planctomycetota bacterium]